MRITIHRAAQIGGQITRISTARASILIDLGHNLPRNNEDEDPYDNDPAIAELTKGCSAILYTHYHGDHIGLFHHVPDGIPQYIGEVARQVVCRKYKELCPDNQSKFCQALDIASRMHTFREGETLRFGDISVTPYFVSHSAYDAYMFLIEAEGKRILHTGDFRGHGYLSKGLLPVIQRHIGQVDVLIIEGTMLARRDETILTEAALSQKAAELMKEHKYVFVHCSSTDMERLASFKNARMYPHRFLMADECHIHDNYKEKLIKASDVSTIVTGKSMGDAVRCLKTPFSKKFFKMEYDPEVPKEEVLKFGAGSLRKAVFDGDSAGGSFLAGEVAGMITRRETAAEIVNDIITGAERLLSAAPGLIEK